MLNQANIVQELKTHQEEFAHSLQNAFKANLMQTLQDFNDVGNEENTPLPPNYEDQNVTSQQMLLSIVLYKELS